MPNRVILGNYGGFTGLRVSKPGYEVLDFSDANEHNLLFDSNLGFSRVFASGYVQMNSNYETVYFADVGAGVPNAFMGISQNFGQWSISPIVAVIYPDGTRRGGTYPSVEVAMGYSYMQFYTQNPTGQYISFMLYTDFI